MLGFIGLIGLLCIPNIICHFIDEYQKGNNETLRLVLCWAFAIGIVYFLIAKCN